MIIEQAQKTAVSVGNIQENVVGIDAKNVNFITSLLTEKLYSYPIESFIREIVSNAYDSHIEAGSDEPVLITIEYAKSDKYEISIRDYGVGLSPERFEMIYKNIGSSSKRESNDYIGCLGIGRFAGLAVSGMCTIISYYNGTKDVYVMYKDEGTVHIDRVSSSKTGEKNGLSVSCVIDNNYSNSDAIKRGILDIAYFPQIYVHNETRIPIPENFNKRKVIKHKSYAYILSEDCTKHKDGITAPFDFGELSTGIRYEVLYGNVLYPVNIPAPKPPKTFLPAGREFVLRFDIGELDITPSREALQMTKKTVNALYKKIAEYNKEILDTMKGRFKEFSDFSELFTGFGDSYYSFLIPFDEIDGEKIYGSTHYEFYASLLGNSIYNSPFKDEKGNNIVVPAEYVLIFVNSLFLRTNSIDAEYKHLYDSQDRARTYNYTNIRTMISALKNSSLFVNKDKVLSPILRLYIKKQPLKDIFIFSKKEEHKFIEACHTTILSNIGKEISLSSVVVNKTTDIYFKTLLRGLFSWYFNSRKELSKRLLPESIFDEWKALHPKVEREKKKVDSSDVILYYIDPWAQKVKKLDNNKTALNYKGTVVYMDKNNVSILELCKLRDFSTGPCLEINSERVLFVATANKNLEWCKESGFVPVEDWINNETNPFFKRLSAITLWIRSNKLNIQTVNSLLNRAGNNPWIPSRRMDYFNRINIEYIYKLKSVAKDSYLGETIESCIKNNFVDWKLFAKLPTISELTLLKINIDELLPRKSSISLWNLALMKSRVIPFNVKMYSHSKKVLNECIKGWR